MRTIVLSITADFKKAESETKGFVSFAAKELAKLNGGGASIGASGGSGTGGRSFGLAETQITGYHKLADQMSAVKDRFEQAKGAVSAFGERVSSAAASLKSVGVGLSAGLTAPIVAFGYKAVNAAQESADALGQVEARLKSMGNVSGRTSEQLQKSATELMHLSTFDDDDILRNVTASMLTFGQVSGEQFDRAQLAAVNMSTALKTDLQSASLQVGKALNDPIKGITALTRAGVSFTSQQKDQIKTLVASGKTVEAQKLILNELEKEFGGAAKAARDNDPWAVLKNSYDDFSESVGGILITAGKPILDFIGNLLDAFNNLSPGMKAAIVAVAAVAAAIGPAIVVVSTLVEGIIAVGGAIITLVGILPELAVAGTVLAVVAASAYALYEAWTTNFGGIRDYTLEAWEAIKSATGTAIAAVYELTTKIGGQIVAWWNENYPLIQQTVQTVSDAIKNYIDAFLQNVSDFWKAHGEQIMAVVKAAWSFISDYIGGTIQDVLSVIKAVMQTINGDWSGAWESIGEIAGREMKFIYETIGGTGELILSAAKQIGDYIANNFDAAMVKTGDIVTKGLLDILDAFVNLPAKIVEYAPKFYNAGIGIGEAIIKGFWKGMKGASGFGGNDGEIIDMSGLGSGPGASGGGEAKSKLLGLTLTQANANFKTYQETAKAAGGLDLVGASAGKAAKQVKAFHQELGDLQTVLDAMRKGTMGQESGGRSAIQNTRTNATGLFQVMPANIAAWTKEYYGKALSVTEFKKNTEAQVAVFNGEMGKYLQTAMKKAGGDVKIAVRMAAAGWYGGKGAMGRYDDPTVFRKGEPSFREYTMGVLGKTMRSSGGGKTPEIESFTQESKVLQDIAETRARINQLIAGGGDENQKQLDTLNTQKSNLEEIGKLVEQINNSGLKQQLVVGLPDTPEDAAKTVERLKALTELQKNIGSENDAAKQKIYDLSQQMTDGLTDLEKFDEGLRILRESGKLTADDFGLLSDNIEEYRQNLKKISELETAKKLAAEAKTVSASLSEMADNFKASIGELNQTKDLEPFTGFLDQIKQVKDLDLPTDAFAEFKTAISPDGIDTEKLASVARFWLEVSAAVGGTDPAKIDEIVGKLTQAAKGFNEMNDAQRATKNAADYKSLTENLDGEYQGLMRNGRELTTYEQTLKDLQTTYKDLSESEKTNLLQKAQQIDAVKSAQESYNKLRGIVGESIDAFEQGGFKGLFQSIKDRFKNFLKDMITEWLTSKIFGVFSGKNLGGGNASTSSGGSNQSGGLFGNLFKGLFGGSSGAGNSSGGLFGGSQGSGVFNFAGGAAGLGGSSGGVSTTNTDTANFITGRDGTVYGAGGSNNIFDNFKQMFSTKEGGLFAAKTNAFTGKSSSAAGVMGGIGSLAAIAGGLIGGKFGNVLSMAGTGASLGANFGPWGAAIGAGIGALFGIFGGNSKEKTDKKENFPKLQQGFSDALQQLRDLNANRNAIMQDPGGAVSKAQELRNQIANGFGIQMSSKKYQKQAQAQIASKLAEADSIIAQIKAFADRSSAAKEVDGHIIGEFASGGLMDGAFARQYQNFKRMNGYLTGGIPGKDSIPAYLMPKEIVVNEAQQARIRQIAGVDAFAYAGIPNYPAPKKPLKLADGGSFGVSAPIFQAPATSQPSDAPIIVNVYVSQDSQGAWHTEAQSDAGRKVIAKAIEEKFRNGELKLKPRTA